MKLATIHVRKHIPKLSRHWLGQVQLGKHGWNWDTNHPDE